MSTVFTVEKGVPRPKLKGRNSKYPWADMEVGDSFAAPKKLSISLVNSAAQQSRKRGWKFSVRTMDEQTCRVWRIA